MSGFRPARFDRTNHRRDCPMYNNQNTSFLLHCIKLTAHAPEGGTVTAIDPAQTILSRTRPACTAGTLQASRFNIGALNAC